MAVSGAMAQDDQSSLMPAAAAPAFTSDFSLSADTTAMAIGYLTPAYSSVAVEPAGFMTGTSGLALTDIRDISGRYTASLYGGSVGVFGGYAGQSLVNDPLASTAWNFGASVGYAGVYLLGGISDYTTRGPFQSLQGWQAGLGYEIGNFDLRLTFASAQPVGVSQVGALDSRQWAIGGMYELTPRIRLNADAFYGANGMTSPSAVFVSPSNAPPQGTGARVGVQLRF